MRPSNVVLVLALSAVPATAQAADVTCGATITSDTRLAADLTNCAGDGLVIGADRISLDLGGHMFNAATRNGGLGIFAAEGVRYGGGNAASGNANALQCVGIECRGGGVRPQPCASAAALHACSTPRDRRASPDRSNSAAISSYDRRRAS